MFCDQTTVRFIAGQGGNGCMAFRREKFVPFGGPNGGDGGHGGNVILMADENVNTLHDLNTQKIFRAQCGNNGEGSNKTGRTAPDMIIKVPVGTMIFELDRSRLIADLGAHGQQIIIAKGGKGGLGNQHFANSVNQVPRFAEMGEPGVEKEVLLELKLVADVGIIGEPNAGKSTLISRCSRAKPKIADYPFTTITPNLGVVQMKEFTGEGGSFVIADIPGLIEGAHAGKGLGHEFLRHISRTHVLIHMIDIFADDISKTFKTINGELKMFDKSLAKKPQLVVINKIDAVPEKEAKQLKSAFVKKHAKYRGKVFLVSAVSGEGLKELMLKVWEVLKESEKQRRQELILERKRIPTEKTFRPKAENEFKIKYLKKEDKKRFYDVTGQRIEQLAVMTDFSNLEGLQRIVQYMDKSGIYKALKKAGAQEGDYICIREKYIMFPQL